MTKKPCCDRDNDSDGQCDVHPYGNGSRFQELLLRVKRGSVRRTLSDKDWSQFESALEFLYGALEALHAETASYIEVNKLGDPHHNQSMKDAEAALLQCEYLSTSRGFDKLKIVAPWVENHR